MSFSDFPVPVEDPPIFSLNRYYEYLQSYVEHFDLSRYIHFCHTVTRVTPAKDYDETGQWEVFVKSRDSEIDQRHVFDAVCLCSGALKKGFTPGIPCLSSFEGIVMHSTQYRRPEVFEGRRVLVVGNSFSAGDQACAISDHAKKVYLSVGDGTYVLPQTAGGIVTGHSTSLSRRIWQQSNDALGEALIRKALSHLDHARFGIGDGGKPLCGGSFMKTDAMAPCLMTGKITIAPKVESFTKDSVRYVDGTAVKIDAVLFATGYLQCYEFVDCSDIKGDRQADFTLYKGVFPLSCKHATLAVISGVPLTGSYPLPTELAARWTACVLAGKCHLPDLTARQKWVSEKQRFFREKCRGKYQMTAFALGEEIAAEFGVQPRFSTLFFRSPSLAYKVYFGPLHTCHYRLVGHGASDVAWKHSHQFYDHIFPDDIPCKMQRLAWDVGIGSLLAFGVYLINAYWRKLVRDWE